MNILGLSAYSHESSVCLLKDGAPAALLEEERFNRERHTSRFPENAIREALRLGGLAAADVQAAAFFWQPWREILGNAAHVARHLPASLGLLRSPSGSEEQGFAARWRRQLSVGGVLRSLGFRGRVRFVEHHLCHAASAFFVSPFEEAAILTIDGRGESATTLWARGRGERIRKLREFRVPHSLGHLYAAVTGHLGFRPFHDEWKVMALAAYGGGALVEDFRDVLRLEPDGGFRLNLDYFSFHVRGRSAWLSEAFARRFGAARKPGDEISPRHCDLAFALQRSVERAGLALARALHAETGLPDLCLAGGVALNCLMNKVILEEGPFRRVFIQPVANDAGTSLGGALYYHHQVLGNPRGFIWRDAYLGPGFTSARAKEALERRGVACRRVEDPARVAARWLSEGKIVGWFQGRMEAGPRALGNRSLLADPRRAEMKELLNARIKKREWFRPFAPAVTAEAAREFFRLKQDSPFMVLAADVLPEKRALIPAVVHRDGTARVQTVAREDNPRFWDLLSEFGRLTGVPVLLNTSFNENEPIVCTPEQAVDCFLRTGIDALVIEDMAAERPAGA